MTKFKVGDKVRILDAKSIQYGDMFWQDDVTTKVTRIEPERGVFLATSYTDTTGLYVTKAELRYIELVSVKPTKNQRITNLESEVAELKAKVEALEKAQSNPKYTLDGLLSQVKPTPNEQRKAIIAEAKAFVAEVTPKMNSHLPNHEGNVTYRHKTTIPEFHVNTEKRVVTALVKGVHGGRIFEKAIAKCAPDDVFNADIGKAIALGRALGLDVSRFEQAVKPTEVVVGHHVKGNGDPHVYCVVPDFEDDDDVLSLAFCLSRKFSILDDTEAKY